MPTAYSYLRFSSPEQAKGDSIRRQAEATAQWCQRNGATLDTSLSLRDEGVSAFKGKNRENPDVHGMAAFLQAVKTGRVPVGSYLVLENLDRLTRESIVPAVNLFTGLLMAGVKIVQLRPVEQVFTAGADMTGVMLALVELSRGNSESVMKSERICAAWSNKRKQASTKVLTRRIPTWLTHTGEKLALDPKKAETVRKLFSLANCGLGLTQIASRLNDSRVPVLGRKQVASPNQLGVQPDKKTRRPVVWSASLVYKILTSRAVIGEYQPHRGRGADRKPVGDPIPDYYPPVITREEFAATQAGIRRRATIGRGRRGQHVNLFAGLLRDARTGGSLTVAHHSARESVIFPSGATHGRGDRWVSYPLAAFEKSVLSQLVEIKVEELQSGGPTVSRVETLRSRLAEVESLLKKWRAKMDRPELVDVVADKLSELEAERREATGQLAEAEQEGATPLAEAMGQLRTLGKAIEQDNGDQTRLHCRSAIRRAVESIWCLFMPGRGTRVAAVQVWFKGGAHRDYLILCRGGFSNGKAARPGSSWVRSLHFPGQKGELDLRVRQHAADFEKVLLACDLKQLENLGNPDMVPETST